MSLPSLNSVVKSPLGIFSAIALAALLVSGAVLAQAAETPTINTVVRNDANTAVTSAPIGTSVHAHVVLTAATSSDPVPAGSVDVSTYANASCSGTASVQSGVALVGGVADSATSTVSANGISYKVHYNGQTDVFPPVDGTCQAVSATASSVGLSLSLASSTLSVGSATHASAVLTGATGAAGGTVAYTSYSDAACSANAVSGGTKTVTNALVPDSDARTFNSTGSFSWKAVYSGDASNAAATSTCVIETVVATSTTPTTTPATGTGAVHGVFYNDTNKSDVQDSGEAGIAGFTVWLHQVPAGQKHTLKLGYGDPIIMTGTTDNNGAYAFDNLAPGSYFVEEKTMAGWHQNDGDRFVTVVDGTITTANFGNFATASTTKPHGHGDDDNDGDDDGHGKGNGHRGHGFFGNFGNHFGWFKHGHDD